MARLRARLWFSVLCLGAPLLAQDWPHWRGPHFNGSTDAKDLPTDFDQQKRVRWAADLPGPGECTPIVVGDRVFLSSVDSAREKLVALCVDRKDGMVLWSKDAGSGYRAGDAGSPTGGSRATFAAPSPATDGERVVFFFGNGDLVAYDFAGAEQWRRNLQKDYGDFAFNWTFSASPTCWEGKLYLPVLQRDVPVQRGRGQRGGRRGRRDGQRAEESPAAPAPAEAPEPAAAPDPIDSFVLALDPRTGETLYKHARPSQARMESRESYTTIVPFVGADGRKELLLAGGDVLTGHDPASGGELWRWGTWNDGHRERAWRLVPTVVAGGPVALVCAPKQAPVYAVRLGGKGELDAEALVWQSEGRRNPVSSDVPTPAFDDGWFYVLSDVQNAVSKVGAKDGEVVWTTELPRDHLWRASPTVADGKIWFINHGGEVFVVDATSGEIVHKAAMGEPDDDRICSSVVIAHGQVLIRTNRKLFCIGG